MVTCSDAAGAAGGDGDGDAAERRGAAAGEEHIVGGRGVAIQVRADCGDGGHDAGGGGGGRHRCARWDGIELRWVDPLELELELRRGIGNDVPKC